MLTPPDGFVWVQPDAMILECTDCGTEVRAGVLDLHRCGE